MADVEMTEGDYGSRSALAVSLRNQDNSRFVPNSDATITITLTRRGDGHQITGSCTLTTTYSAEGDEITWEPEEGDLAVGSAGLYDAQWLVVEPGVGEVSVPNKIGPTSIAAFTVEICPRG